MLSGNVAQGPQRVILEDPSESKASIVFAGVILLLVLGGGALGLWRMRDQGAGRRDKIAPAEPASVQQVRSNFADRNPEDALRNARKYISQAPD